MRFILIVLLGLGCGVGAADEQPRPDPFNVLTSSHHQVWLEQQLDALQLRIAVLECRHSWDDDSQHTQHHDGKGNWLFEPDCSPAEMAGRGE